MTFPLLCNRLIQKGHRLIQKGHRLIQKGHRLIQKPRRRPSREAQRGFTLVELMVALTAGLIVAAAAFSLARKSMTAFQEESRIASSQMGATLGLARMNADLQRAGYMVSPNVALDPRICRGVPRADVPLAAAQIVDGGSGDVFGTGGLDASVMGYGAGNSAMTMPDVAVIAGNMTSAEQFEYRVIDGSTVHLAVDRGPIQRAFEDLGRDSVALEAVFVPTLHDQAPGRRFARIVEPSGKESYVVVTGALAMVTGTTLDSFTLTITDPLGAAPANSGGDCGFVNRGVGLINPVSLLRYRIAKVCDPVADPECDDSPTAFGDALRATGENLVTGESTRAELVREEILPGSAATPFNLNLILATGGAVVGLATQELVAEFAVELDFSVFHAPNVGGPPGADPTLLLETGPSVTGLPGQRLRSLRVRLSTRARVPDRDAPSPTLATSRFELTPLIANNTPNRWARVRTLHAEIQLPNLQGVAW